MSSAGIKRQAAGTTSPNQRHLLQSIKPQLTPTRAEALGLAPSRAIMTKAKQLARPWLWLELGRAGDDDATLVWGRLAGRHDRIDVAMVRLSDLHAQCSCSGRVRPCAHMVGLLLLCVDWPNELKTMALPTEPQPQDAQRTRTAAVVAGAGHAYARRRLARLRKGLDLLDRWLCDLVGGGLHAATYRPEAFWTTMVNELDSCHAPRLAAEIRTMKQRLGRLPNWPDLLVADAGRLYLLIAAFRTYEEAAPARQSDLHAAIGWPLLWDVEHPVRDQWWILAAPPTEERRVHPRDVWLAGVTSGALLSVTLRAEHGGLLRVGRTADATLVPAHGAAAAPALLQQLHAIQATTNMPPASQTVAGLIARHSGALAANPWHTVTPVVVACDAVVRHEATWYVRARNAMGLPLPERFDQGWTLHALALAGPLTIFALWDGTVLTPLSVWTEAGWVELRALRGVR